MVYRWIRVLVLSFCACPSESSYGYSHELQLRADMSGHYSRSIRPVLDQSRDIHVRFSFELLNIEAMDITTQTLTVTAWCMAKWEDELMRWDKRRYGGADKFYVHAGDDFDIWTPDIIVMNTIGEFVKLGNDGLPRVVQSTGQVTMESGVSLSTHCDADITFYPFDTQSCDIIVGAVVYSLSELNMTIEQIITDNYRENGEWELVNLVGSRDEITLDVDPETLLNFTLTLRRLRPFFLMNLVVPLMLLSALNVVVFALPVESGERISLSITTLLSYAVFLSAIGDSLPNTSRSSPIVGVYVLITFILSTLSVCLSVLVLNLHGRQGEPLPEWLRRLFSSQLCARLSNPNQDRNRNRKISCVRHSIKTEPATEIIPEKKEELVDCEESVYGGDECSKEEDSKSAVDEKSSPNKTPDVDVSWNTIARVLDRLFFWLFLSVCLLVCVTVIGLWVTH